MWENINTIQTQSFGNSFEFIPLSECGQRWSTLLFLSFLQLSWIISPFISLLLFPFYFPLLLSMSKHCFWDLSLCVFNLNLPFLFVKMDPSIMSFLYLVSFFIASLPVCQPAPMGSYGLTVILCNHLLCLLPFFGQVLCSLLFLPYLRVYFCIN